MLNRTNRSTGCLIYPGVKSDDPNFLRFTEELVRVLRAEFPMELTEHGVCGSNGIASGWTKPLNVAGYVMNPNSLPPIDNTWIREEIGLDSQGFKSERHREILAEVVKAVAGHARAARLSINRSASMGAPFYHGLLPVKKQLVEYALQNLDRLLEAVKNNDLITLLTVYNAAIVQVLGERIQPDVLQVEGNRFVPKVRRVNLEAFARGQDKEARIDANKDVVINGSILLNHSACRRRVVYGMSFVVNHIIAAIFSQFREYYLNEFAYTWKHRSSDEIEEKVNSWQFFAGFDVTQMDSTVPAFLIDATCDELEKYMDERAVKLIRLMCRAPFIAPHPYYLPDEGVKTNPLYGDDPLSVDSFNFKLGLPSGIACNPDFGKIFMMFQYLVLMDDLRQDVLEVGVERILKGLHTDYAFLNAGDDCVIMMNDQKLFEIIRDGKYRTDYFKVEPESPISFLGNVFYEDKGRIKVAPNMESFLANWLVPERGIDHWSRRNFWAIGATEREAHYSRAPSYGPISEIYRRLFIRHLGVDPNYLVDQEFPKQLLNKSLSTIDMLVLQNPSYLHYRYTEDDVSKEVLDLIVSSVSAATVVPAVAPFISAKIEGDVNDE